MYVVGIDLSIRSTGVGTVETHDGVAPKTGSYLIRTKPGDDDHPTFERIIDRIVQATAGSDLTVMEGIAFSSYDTRRRLAGLWWLVTHRLWEEDTPVATLPPASLKLYATGRGDSPKPVVINAIQSDRFPYCWTNQADEADALVLACAGARVLGNPIDRVTVEQQAAVLKGDWP